MGDATTQRENTPRRAPFILWAMLIFALCPFARSLQEYFAGAASSKLLILMGAAPFALLWVFRLRKNQLLLCLLVGAVYGALCWKQRHAPEEIFHLFEYGVLSLLALRLLPPDPGLASRFTALTWAGTVGIFEELFQWLLPNRIFDVRDIVLNFEASFLAQAASLAVTKNALDKASVSSIEIENLLRALRFATCAALLLVVLSPPLLELIGLAFRTRLVEDEALLEFGEWVEPSKNLSFRSRFSGDRLKALDSARGAALSPLLDAHRTPAEREAILASHSALRDPFFHEAEVHLFAREHSLREWRNRGLPEKARKSAAQAALAEERILQDFFPVSTGSRRLAASLLSELQDDAAPGSYVSPAGQSIVTAFSRKLAAGTLIVVAAILTQLMRFQIKHRRLK